MKKNKKVQEEVIESTETKIEDAINIEPLSIQQEIGALRKVHEYLSEFDRVPGSMSASWSQMLDTIAVVANSLIAKLPKEELQVENN